jgi:hypothetical protein
MRFRVTLSWITVTVLALSAEGAAVAQSAPAHPGSASDPPGRIEQGSASAGPELEAARASLAGTPKKNDTGPAVTLNSLANRQVAAGNTVASGLAMPTGAGAPIQSNGGGGESLQALHGDATGVTSTTAGPAIRFVPVGGPQGGGPSVSAPAPHAEAVLRGQINPAAKSCYENDPDSKSRRPGKLVILIKLNPAGEIDFVSESSNIGLSPSVVACITTAASAAKFAAPGANGATVRAAFTFPGREDAAPPAAARAMAAQVAHASGPAAPPALAEADAQPRNGETSHH